ncbi:hypothetical protein BDQ17DRAFT_1371569 [Cyathus striatus]|nr:hypothetical protein BDQ17DRAFT_1371569 [Cyathus striatus]
MKLFPGLFYFICSVLLVIRVVHLAGGTRSTIYWMSSFPLYHHIRKMGLSSVGFSHISDMIVNPEVVPTRRPTGGGLNPKTVVYAGPTAIR